MRKTDHPQRAYWLKTLHQWHWISSAVCLLGMLLFSVTGITLNHAAQIESRPAVTARELQLPPELKALVTPDVLPSSPRAPLPARLADWIQTQIAVDVRGRDAEWSDEELYISLPRPGGDAWLRIDRESGAAEYERTDRGWISYLNDLHKGRHTGVAWSWFIDLFAVACLVFCLTGLFILKLHAANRPTTWPIVGLGLVIPLLLTLLFIH
ncbi:PepSY-associated TM helix domain-containing protein [Methylibium petroleiphilum]|uniref:Putative membrane protein n=1 Tax=Methylibium petroleiphilum (strain ATCC BAA-1232 / LMG 22953 / PM1) TaxID=420662 RepID=A2SM94_METPP|nr:PepSY-associated TM helix domain-containing protein [Methylibium petroleiphilum]ABM96683.1 putative membrane protein [Methylibium petroleiphilum PM1]